MSAIIYFPHNPANTGSRHLRTAAALLIATALHVILLTVPVDFYANTPAAPKPISISLRYEQIPATEKAASIEAPEAQEIKTESGGGKSSLEKKKVESKTEPKPEKQQAREKNDVDTHSSSPVPSIASPQVESVAPHRYPSQEGGAKSRSTVFDPRLSQQLQKTRNKVQKFETRNTELATENGVFIQRGNSCWEFKQLLPAGSESTVTQRFNINCSQRHRSQEDIDRLAERYGIP